MHVRSGASLAYVCHYKVHVMSAVLNSPYGSQRYGSGVAICAVCCRCTGVLCPESLGPSALQATLGAAAAAVSDAAAASDMAAAADIVDEEEASLLPLLPDPAAAAEAFNTAAEEASAAFKGKLAQRYFERAAEAEAAAEEQDGQD